MQSMLLHTQGFSPRSAAELKRAFGSCVRQLPKSGYSIAGWDVSNVRHMSGMFRGATSFNKDISRWQVSNVLSMKNMFRDAVFFKHSLCGHRWVHSQAIQTDMFVGSTGSISRHVCTSARPAPQCTGTTPGRGEGDVQEPPPVSQQKRTKMRTKAELQSAVQRHVSGEWVGVSEWVSEWVWVSEVRLSWLLVEIDWFSWFREWNANKCIVNINTVRIIILSVLLGTIITLLSNKYWHTDNCIFQMYCTHVWHYCTM